MLYMASAEIKFIIIIIIIKTKENLHIFFIYSCWTFQKPVKLSNYKLLKLKSLYNKK